MNAKVGLRAAPALIASGLLALLCSYLVVLSHSATEVQRASALAQDDVSQGTVTPTLTITPAQTVTPLVTTTPEATVTPTATVPTTPQTGTITLSETNDVAIILTATVGTNSGRCGVATTLAAGPDDTVYYCYTLGNRSPYTLTNHDLRDGVFGDIWRNRNVVLAPGAEVSTVDVGQSLGTTLDRTTVNTVIWQASAPGATTPVSAVQTAATTVGVFAAGLDVTKTVGIDPNLCAATQAITVARGTTVSYCVTVANTGDITFTRFAVDDPLLKLKRSFAYTLAPNARLVLTSGAASVLSPTMRVDPITPPATVTTSIPLTAAWPLTRHHVLTPLLNSVLVTATWLADGVEQIVAADAEAEFTLAPASVVLTKSVSTASGVINGQCPSTTSLTVASGTQIYYCVEVRNTGATTLTHHLLFERELSINLAFTYTLAPGAMLTVTNDVLSTRFGLSALFGPFTMGSLLPVLNSTLTYTGTSSEGDRAVASAGISVVIGATPTPTETSRPDPTRTFTPVPTWTPLPTPIPPTPTPTFIPIPPPPTDTPTPTRSYAISVLATPTRAPTSPLAQPTPTDDPAMIAAMTMVAAVTMAAATDEAATATAAAETPTPTWTPTATETPAPTEIDLQQLTPMAVMTLDATATMSGTPNVVLIVVTNTPGGDAAGAVLLPTVGAPRPLETPTPTATLDYLLLGAHILDRTAQAAGWIWFLAGSLVFFVVAGLIAGLAFGQQEASRYELREAYPAYDDVLFDDGSSTMPDEYDERYVHGDATDVEPYANEQPGGTQSGRRTPRSRRDDDDWPDSLP